MGKAKTLPDYPRGLDFEQVWAALMENRELLKETDRIIKENARETDRQMKENAKQMEERDRRLDKKMGDLTDRFGEMIEHMVMPSLVEKFRELDFVFTKAYPHSKIKDDENKIIAEVDITLENGDKVMIVEVKSKPNEKDVKDHIKRMEKVKAHANLHNDSRKYLGAIAGMVFNNNAKDFALENGFYVIEPSGEEFVITVPKGDCSPREW